MKIKVLAFSLAILCAVSSICITPPTAVLASESNYKRIEERLKPFYEESYDGFKIYEKNEIDISQKFCEITYNSYISGDWEHINEYCDSTLSRIEKRTLIANRRNGDLALKKETALNQLLTGSVSIRDC